MAGLSREAGPWGRVSGCAGQERQEPRAVPSVRCACRRRSPRGYQLHQPLFSLREPARGTAERVGKESGFRPEASSPSQTGVRTLPPPHRRLRDAPSTGHESGDIVLRRCTDRRRRNRSIDPSAHRRRAHSAGCKTRLKLTCRLIVFRRHYSLIAKFHLWWTFDLPKGEVSLPECRFPLRPRGKVTNFTP
jgi:hypothetical protein